ncbi:MAG TPA: NADH-quinone oxidoreductase subunit L [Pyrinomonadaceae bacterium]|nr:NADH-quinone oxidoreductase subunit L [Pyrinomonadaceae bacterium]
MYQYIWLVPLLPLIGAAINGIFGRWFRFPEKLISGIAVGSVALSFLISVAAIYSYGFGGDALWPNPYVTTQAVFTWIPGGAVQITQGSRERVSIALEKKAAEKLAAMTPEQRSANRNILIGASDEPRSSVLNIEWSYQLDPLSAVFMLIVTGVGLCIFVFATGYMHGDTGFYRFFAYMGLFMFSMLVLVMGSNFVVMFVGWEGVGLCSYLLIGYYFNRAEAANASRKAFITNRIGDFGFMLAVFAIIATFGSAQFTNVIPQAASYPVEILGHWGLMSWIALGLMIGACGKSAQFPLHVWLPDAMAGPTPVSALIHAATMVTAGLYMLTRTNVIFQHSQTMMLVVAIVGAFTAIFAATIGITQNDIKKVLAYSTVSQLGFMFLACGVGAFVIGIFHVMTHAFFKALMFLGAGSVIHGMHHEQDMRRMGNLRKYMPYTYLTFLAGWLAICGIIPFSGFWSKDEILWRTASTNHIPIGWLLWIVGTIAATCTAFYMTRLVAMTFWGKERFGSHEHTPGHEVHEDHPTPGHHVHTPHESPKSMWIPLVVLAILATVGGFVGISTAFTGGRQVGGRFNIVHWMNPVIWNPVTKSFHVDEPLTPAQEPKIAETPTINVLRALPSSSDHAGFNLAHAVEAKLGSETAAEWVFIIISLLVAGIGIGLGFLFYVKDTRLPDIWATRLGPLYRASYNKYWIDEFFGWTFTRRTMDLARGVFAFDSKVVDRGVNGSAWLTRLSSRITGGTDKYLVDGLVNAIGGFVVRLMSPMVRAAQTGLTQNYALIMVIGLLAAIALYLVKIL